MYAMAEGVPLKKLILSVVVLVVISSIVWYFNTFYERYDKEFQSGYSSEAIKNPFLAAKQFLQDRGVKFVEETDELDFDSIGFGEIVFLSKVDDMILTQSQIDEALEWVGAGGSLIIGVGEEIQGNASLLEYFDIDPVEYSRDSSDFLGEGKTFSERLRERNKKIESSEDQGEDLTVDDMFDEVLSATEALGDYSVSLNENDTLTINNQDRIVLNHPSLGDVGADEQEAVYGTYENHYSLDDYARDGKGSRFLQFSYGDGHLTALSSTLLWQNSNIDSADHAYFLALLVPEKSTIRFFYNIISPSIYTLVKRNFLESLIAALLLLVAWVWYSALRVQGVRHEATTQRRAFSEHLKASAEFLISKQQYNLLLEPMHADINAQMRLTHLGYNDMSAAEQIPLLAVKTGFAKETIQSWFDALTGVDNHEHMIAIIKIGNEIRNKL